MRRLRSWTLFLVLAVMACSLVPAQAEAQRPRRQGGATAERGQLERRIRIRFAEMIRERLGLDDEASRRLGETMDSFQSRRQALGQEDLALQRRMEAILLEADPTPGAAEELIDRLLELRDEEAALFRAEQEALLEVLTPVQLVRFHAMREQLGRRIQELRGGQGPPGGVRRPGGLGGQPGGPPGYL